MKLILFLCICMISLKGNAQTIEKKSDSVSVYQNINDLSKKSKFSRFVYKLIFKESALKAENLVPFKPKKEVKVVKKHQEGKVIRDITIETLDPFGYSVTNEKKVPKHKLEHFGNTVHIKTKEVTIRNSILFKKYDKLDSKLLLESERLIRSQRYIREVTIVPVDIPKNKDSIDIKIRVLDSWTLIPTGTLSSTESSAKLTERNILGFGHLISGNVKNRFDTKERATYAQYSINNIKNTFVRFDFNYGNDFDNDSRRSININRPFYSVIAKNAGGIYYENQLMTELFPQGNEITPKQVSYDFQEYWYGRALKVTPKSNSERYFTNLILALTYNEKKFNRTPSLSLDPTRYFSNEKNWIGMIGVSRQKFYQDTFVFNYYITEDIPYGENIALIIGHQEKNSNSRMYTGLSVSYGKKCSFGYASGFAEWGSFYDAGLTEQTTFRLGLNYFSPLINIGNWRFRQFIKPTYVWGNNRDESFKDRLTLLDEDGLPGFNNRLNGTQKWTVSFQTQSYIPGSWYGFRFSPYFNM
ncbi:hypothetical protein, partial [Flavobacterium sp. UBA6195]|uniref:hypothetical protein n=1 Tax=Flavobacterium sp. UBA6195 TaxID=1946554 RepID=UPI0025BD1CB4